MVEEVVLEAAPKLRFVEAAKIVLQEVMRLLHEGKEYLRVVLKPACHRGRAAAGRSDDEHEAVNVFDVQHRGGPNGAFELRQTHEPLSATR
jgi:hypothetical protein